MGNLECNRLSTVCMCLKRSICCGFAWKRDREAFFSSCAILHGTCGSISALSLNEKEEGRMEGEEDRRLGGGKAEGEEGHRRL